MSDPSAPVPSSGERTASGCDFRLGDGCLLSGQALSASYRYLRTGDDLYVVVTGIGSNYVECKWPALYVSDTNRAEVNDTILRLHTDSLNRLTKLDAAEFNRRLSDVQAAGMGQIARLTAQAEALVNEQMPTSGDRLDASGAQSLMVLSQCRSPDEVKHSLEAIRDTRLPAVYHSIAIAVGESKMAMRLQLLGMTAKITPMEDMIKTVEAKMFTIELYAGVHETVRHFRVGEAAAQDEKLCVFQRMVYMDEESLLDYQSGGMDFRSVDDWDSQWLSNLQNMNRVMPFPKTMMIARVRRKRKERETYGMAEAFVRIAEDAADQKTFIYIRNGDNLYRIDTGIDFGERAFPDPSVVNQSEEMAFEMFASSIRRIIPARVLEAERAAGCYRSGSNWHPLNPSSVYYDDAMAFLKAETDAFQRFGLILQGLFDRSTLLQPCPRVKLWDEQSFSDHVRLILDSDRTLHHGEEPDFEAYREALNSQVTEDSIFVGQRDYWLRKQAEKENNRQRHDYRIRTPTIYTRFAPRNDNGPALMMSGRLSRGRRIAFRWEQHDCPDSRKTKTHGLTVPLSELLNLSAYKKGDYKRFFSDPRTREKYLEWAPFLLAGEDFIAAQERGNIPDAVGLSSRTG